MKYPLVYPASDLIGDNVRNQKGEALGKIEDLMIDLETGAIAYAVLSFGGVFGIGDKLFAIPWESLELDPERKEYILDIEKERLQAAPGFDKSNWPDFADKRFGAEIYDYYQQEPFWDEEESLLEEGEDAQNSQALVSNPTMSSSRAASATNSRPANDSNRASTKADAEIPA